MKSFLIGLFLFSSLCGGINIYSQNNDESLDKLLIQPPLLGNCQSVIYKVGIDVFGNYFSGLLLIKKDKSGEGQNIVFLSEVGITICEYFRNGNNIELRNASALFQNKNAQKLLAEDFGMLLFDPLGLKVKRKNSYKSKEGYRYFLNVSGKINRIRKCRLINSIDVTFVNEGGGVPSTILFKHKGIKFKMNLKLLKQN